MPAVKPADLSPINLPRLAQSLSGHPDTILLAMDEPSIGRMLTRVFAGAGLKVVWVTDIGEGLGWFRSHHDEIAVVFVDCHQSGLQARDFCREVRSLHPMLPVLLAGGHDAQHSVEELGTDGPTVFVPKPYLPTELAWQLRGLVAA